MYFFFGISKVTKLIFEKNMKLFPSLDQNVVTVLIP